MVAALGSTQGRHALEAPRVVSADDRCQSLEVGSALRILDRPGPLVNGGEHLVHISPGDESSVPGPAGF